MVKKNKFTWFDALIIAIVLFAGTIYGLARNQQPNLGNQQVLIEIKTTDTSETRALIESMNQLPKEVFLNGTKYPVQQVGYRVLGEDLDNSLLIIQLVGPGDLSYQNKEIFNGQRVLINQKAEIRGSYFVQGKIQSYKIYESKNN